MTCTYIGVDLSKDWIDIFHPQTGATQIANTPAEVRAYLRRITAPSVLVFEATSDCDTHIQQEATRLDLPFSRLNPLHAWHFARSLNLPKTDRVDARMLARFGAERAPRRSTYAAEPRRTLSALNTRRDQLKRMIVQEKNRLSKTELAIVAKDIKASLAALERRVERIEREIAKHLNAHPSLDSDAQLLRSIPGIGAVCAVQLLAHMPELGTLDRKKIASLVGLAPRARESGKWRGKRFIGDGRRHIRRALYMASLCAMRADSPFNGVVERMREMGKPGKVIAIAIARRLLVTANAVLREQRAFCMH